MAHEGLKIKGKNSNKVIKVQKAENGFVVRSINEYPGDGKERVKVAKDMKEVKSTVQEFLT